MNELELLDIKEIELEEDRGRAGNVGGCEFTVVVSVMGELELEFGRGGEIMKVNGYMVYD